MASNSGYSRVCLLSSGGMGEVEVAIRRSDRSFERLYAIKRPHQKYNHDKAYLTMFEREGRIAGLIRHPNVVSVLDVGTDERGPYLVMDYIQGLALSRLLTVVDGKLPVQIALRITRQVARGLQAAHELRDHRGTLLHIVHRDVSPQNILVGFDGSVYVTDFGIAKPLHEQSMTATGVVKGKMGYLAPELLRFEDVTQRSDLFSLGVVMFEALTDSRLYRGAKVPWRILHEGPPNVREMRPELSQDVADLTASLLSKHPGERPQSARQLVQDLDALIAKLVTREGVHTLDEFARSSLARAREEHKRWLAEGLGALNEESVTAEFSDFSDFGESATTIIDSHDDDEPAMESEQSQPSFRRPEPALAAAFAAVPVRPVRPVRPSSSDSTRDTTAVTTAKTASVLAPGPAPALPRSATPSKTPRRRLRPLLIAATMVVGLGVFFAVRLWAPSAEPAPNTQARTPEELEPVSEFAAVSPPDREEPELETLVEEPEPLIEILEPVEPMEPVETVETVETDTNARPNARTRRARRAALARRRARAAAERAAAMNETNPAMNVATMNESMDTPAMTERRTSPSSPLAWDEN